MLVLGRKEGERIYIGEEIVIKILSIKNRGLQIGITAPPSVQILRDDAKKRQRDLDSHVPTGLLTGNVRKNEL